MMESITEDPANVVSDQNNQSKPKLQLMDSFVPTVRKVGKRTFFNHTEMELARIRAELRLTSYIVQLSKKPLLPNTPNIWNGLKPYAETYCPEFVQALPNDTFVDGKSRLTVQNIVDPEEDVRIDQTKVTLPAISMTRGQLLTQRRKQKLRENEQDRILNPKSKPLPWAAKQGSTHLTPFSKVYYRRPEVARRKGVIDYTDITELRKQMREMQSARLVKKHEEDFHRTVDDFYRMDLNVARDKAHPLNRFLLDQACFVYLGPSRGAIRAYKEAIEKNDSETVVHDA